MTETNPIVARNVDELLTLMSALIDRARADHDGHLTICRFTTNWRVGFKTPNSREDIDAMAEGETFAKAARAALRVIPPRKAGPS